MTVSPLVTNNFLDSCAFDPKYDPEHSAALEIYKLYEAGRLLLQIAHSTLKELEHSNTPGWVKKAAQGLIFTMEVELTEGERDLLDQIERTLAGNGKLENVKQDARHVFEAGKYGSYFITADARILKKALELSELSNATIVTPSEFLRIAHRFIEEDT